MNSDNFDHLNVFDRNEAIKASLAFQDQANPILERIAELKANQRARDRFELAKAAMQGFCANNAIYAHNDMCGFDLVNCTLERLSSLCVDHADALLIELEKEPHHAL